MNRKEKEKKENQEVAPNHGHLMITWGLPNQCFNCIITCKNLRIKYIELN